MFPKLSSYLRRGRSPKEGEKFEDWKVELLATANANLALQLKRADQKITNLTARLAESDLLLAHAQARMGDSTYTALQQDENLMPGFLKGSKEAGRFKWIDDIWIYTGQDYLRNAEEIWRNGDAESACSILESALTASPFQSVAEGLHCRVFLAAILHAIVNTAYFIEAMDFMALERFERAYWSFSRSLQLPGYGEKAREYQIKAIEEFTRQQAADDGFNAADFNNDKN
ncbi:hypothetical protein PENSUB_10477 [Penicillium subrubescens]|uniref:Uncharacterized protein n=1 Tax=Penicillium subrubescens TaxID=1316194 RepID=A0A1Q5T9N4_9EURO|nr:hypothetical protein PENSUB_10477 [Penicillium subrubescens]